jgi:predicted cupin superfamily sugar epimerase
MKRVSLREYSKLHKLSYFNVMKMVKGGDVKSEIVKEDGKDVAYILIDKVQEKKVSEAIIETSAQKLSLKDENRLLKKEIERLKIELEKCNKRTVLA